MRSLYNHLVATLLACALGMVTMPFAHAHLMVAQQGTLNIIDEGVFMVISLPISAFENVDDNYDGKVSMVEFNGHRGAIVESVRNNITMADKQGSSFLQEIMLSPVAPHDLTAELISQLVVMGRFTLNDPASALFHIGLYGKQPAEQSLDVTATRLRGNKKTSFELTPAQPAAVLFPDGA